MLDFLMTLQHTGNKMESSATVLLFEVGIAVLGNNNELVFKMAFDEPVLAYHSIQKGSKQHVAEVVKFLKDYQKVIVNSNHLVGLFSRENKNVTLMSQSEQDEINRTKLELMSRFSFSADLEDSIFKLRQFATEFSSFKVKESSGRLDLHIIQAVNALDEIDEIVNTIGTRMREWYGLHFPELDNLIQNITTYAYIVKNSKSRTEITKEMLLATDLQEKKADIIIDCASKSKGGEITEESQSILKDISSRVIELSHLRTNLSSMIESSMEILAPNLKNMLTAVIGARLISRAGSLPRLAVLPASTIQILGAEKALFRALKTGSSPPKHGLLFQHPLIHSAPKWQRGKIARALAAKIAIAARIDEYRHAEIDNSILENLNKRIELIQKIYAEPPVVTRKPPNFGVSRYYSNKKSDRKSRKFSKKMRGKKRRNLA
jgi:nucleolar protein 56